MDGQPYPPVTTPGFVSGEHRELHWQLTVALELVSRSIFAFLQKETLISELTRFDKTSKFIFSRKSG